MTKQKFSGINFLGFGLGRSKFAFRKEDFDFYAKNSQVHGILRGLSGSFRIIERHFRDGLANREIGTNGSTNINLKDRRVVQIEYENTTAPSEEARGRCHVKKIRVLEPPPSAPRPLALADEPPPPAPMSTKVSVSTSFLKELSELYALANDPKGNVRLSAQRTNAFFDAFFEAAGNHGHGDHKANFGITYARKNASKELWAKDIKEDLEKMAEICVSENEPPERTAPPPPQAMPLAGVGKGNPDLPARLHALDTGLTGIRIDVGALRNFQIYHVPNDGNCLFTAIGYFIGEGEMPQGEVRQQIDAEGARWGGEDEARVAARVFGRRVFIIDHNFETDAPNPNTIRGYEADTGAQIDMAQLRRPINPGQGQKMTLFCMPY